MIEVVYKKKNKGEKKLNDEVNKYVKSIGGKMNKEATEDDSGDIRDVIVYDYKGDLDDAHDKIQGKFPDIVVELPEGSESTNAYDGLDNPPRLSVRMNNKPTKIENNGSKRTSERDNSNKYKGIDLNAMSQEEAMRYDEAYYINIFK